MYINNIGYNHTHDADFHINRPYGSGDYLLVLLKTSALFTLEGSDLMAEPDSFILYTKGKPQYYRADGASFMNDWLHFELQDEDIAWFHTLSIPQDQVVPIGDLNELSIIINHLCHETYTNNHFKSETIALYLRLLFIKLSNRIHDQTDQMANSHYNKMSIVRTKIYNQPFQQWTIDALSHELTMSRSSFQHMYKAYFGVSPITDVILSRIEHAKYLLSTTDIAVKKISEMCGYNNELHFMRQFKKQMRLTPSDYRETKRRVRNG